jgi:HD-like signal output (HDOD) protein/CheY-like chemotaxis protein
VPRATTRILFVDDEPCVLEAIGRTMRDQRAEWSMAFAPGGAEALAEMEREPVDIIVSDMRMPEMDGAELLERVRSRWPETVRILLSGYSEAASTLRAVPVAHQFLAKPCEPKVLREVLQRACSLRSLLENEVVRRTVGGIDALPTPPRIYVEVTRLMALPGVSLDEVATVIRTDPAICAKILHLVNSSFFGLARSIVSVRDALAYLGLTRLKNLLLSVAVFRELSAGGDRFIEREQVHSAIVANLAGQIVSDPRLGEDAFVAGMLHDVGRLVIATRFPGIFERASREAKEIGLGGASKAADHAAIGAYLLGIWALPATVVDAVANHHAPSQARVGSREVVTAVHVADALIHEIGGTSDNMDEGEPPPLIDPGCLADPAIVASLPAWRELAGELLGTVPEPGLP